MSTYPQPLESALGRPKQPLPGSGQRTVTSEKLFSPTRWGLLLTLHWAENRRRYLLALPAIAGLLFAWFSFLLIINKDRPLSVSDQFNTYHVGLYLIGCLYGSTLFSDLGHKTRALQYLAVPASQFEKWLCALFFGVLLFFIVYTCLFYLVDIPMVGLTNRIMRLHPHLPQNGIPVHYPVPAVNLLYLEGKVTPEGSFNVLLLAYFAIQSVFILGSVYFIRYSLVKTIVSGLLFCLVWMLLVKLLEISSPAGWHLNGGLFEWSHQTITGGQTFVRAASWISDTLQFIITYFIPPIFWSITYTRLTEKEV